jgi:hypothetical protein
MKALSTRTQTIRRERAEAMIEARVLHLFQRIPLLLGFSIQEDLSIAGIEVHSWPSYAWGKEVYDEISDEIAAALVGLMNEREDAAELLRGRTFARTFH